MDNCIKTSNNVWDKKLDVFFYEAFKEEVVELRKYLPSSFKVGFTDKTIQEYDDSSPQAKLISIRTQSVIPVSWASELNGILSRSTGYDHLTSYIQKTEKDIPCGYLPLYCSRTVAEQALWMWMGLLRKIKLQMENFNTFYRDGITGQECEKKTLLVVGVGNIGYQIVKIGIGLGMEVFGVDIVKKHNSVSYVSIEEGLSKADIIVCAMNLTDDNDKFFDYNRLKRSKKGAIFINISRGEFSPSTDLLKLIEEKHLGGLGLDVYSQEHDLAASIRKGCKSDNPETQAALKLSKKINVITTPHNAFNTKEALERKAEYASQQVTNFLKTKEFLWNIPRQ